MGCGDGLWGRVVGMGCGEGLWGWVVGMGCGDGLWGWAGTDATPAAFYLGLCRLRGILSPPSATTTYRRRAVLLAGTMALQTELFYFAAKTAAGGTNLLCGKEN